jgi:hypothetical protein
VRPGDFDDIDDVAEIAEAIGQRSKWLLGECEFLAEIVLGLRGQREERGAIMLRLGQCQMGIAELAQEILKMWEREHAVRQSSWTEFQNNMRRLRGVAESQDLQEGG